MCTNCGCSQVEGAMLHVSAGEPGQHEHRHEHEHRHSHDHSHDHSDDHNHFHEHSHSHEHNHFHDHDRRHSHDHQHDHHHGHQPADHTRHLAIGPAAAHTHTLEVQQRLLAKNDRFAQQNRQQFESRGLFVLNLMSSPGSGKTTLIEQTAQAWGELADRVGVIVGDLATENDANRLRSAGASALQITTGSACHLEADMVAQALSHLAVATLKLLVIENVGNLVCPAAYDLGETQRVVLLSVTEGEDKPLKYPTAFQAADVVILTKTDIAAAIGFDRTTAIANIRQMAPQAQIFELSARSGVGMDAWLDYLTQQIAAQLIGPGALSCV